VKHYIPVAHSMDFLNDIFNISISTGGICNLLNKAKQKAMPAYEAIQKLILNHAVIGAKETGVTVNNIVF
jgi:hypothetical protein